MTDRDNITLPREVVQEAVKALEFAERNHDGEQSLYTTEIAALRKALAAEQQEPVADEEAPRLWAWMREGWSADCGPWYEVIRNDQMTWRDRKGWAPLYTALAALAAPRPEPVFDGQSGHPVMLPRAPEPVLGLISDEVRAALKAADAVESQEAYRTRTPAAAPEPTHPGYVIGSHWLETAYSRIAAGEAEADVLAEVLGERGWAKREPATPRQIAEAHGEMVGGPWLLDFKRVWRAAERFHGITKEDGK